MLAASCRRGMRFDEYEDRNDWPFKHLDAIPVIVVGRILADTAAGSPFRPRDYDDNSDQVFRVTMRVENVLRGGIAPGEDLQAFYLRSLGISGPPRMGIWHGSWHIGDREVFFLQKDKGVLRTVCDTFAHCAPPVLSGAHPNYRPQPGEPVSHSIVDILLTRGQDIGDAQMASAIEHEKADGFSWTYTVEKLRELAASDAGPVREQARVTLSYLGNPYQGPQSGQSILHVPPDDR